MKKLPLGTMVITKKVDESGIYFGLIIEVNNLPKYYVRWNDGLCTWYTELQLKEYFVLR